VSEQRQYNYERYVRDDEDLGLFGASLDDLAKGPGHL
jgi:hypothetical protein